MAFKLSFASFISAPGSALLGLIDASDDGAVVQDLGGVHALDRADIATGVFGQNEPPQPIQHLRAAADASPAFLLAQHMHGVAPARLVLAGDRSLESVQLRPSLSSLSAQPERQFDEILCRPEGRGEIVHLHC